MTVGPEVRRGAAPAAVAAPASALFLVAANAVPLAGVLLFQWTIFSIFLLYWVENLVVGAFNVLRMLAAQPRNIAVDIGKVFLIPFFCVHYGLFCFIHGIFVVALFGPHGANVGFSATALIAAVKSAGIGYGILAVVASHGFSFVHNYLMGGEYLRAGPQLLMGQPYARVVVLHITIIAGGFAAMALGAPLVSLVILVALKTAIDWSAHVRERKKLAGDDTAISMP